MNEYPSKDELVAQLNTSFEILLERGELLQLVLAELKEGISTQCQESFSLIFQGPIQSHLPQRIYPMCHPAFGILDLFIVPIAKDEQNIYYEAVFNRLVSMGG